MDIVPIQVSALITHPFNTGMKRCLTLLGICGILLLIPSSTDAQRPSKTFSELQRGEKYKIAVDRAGIHRIDYQLVQNTGLAANFNADLKVFTNGGGPLRQVVSDERVDDLVEIATYRVGLDDGSFDEGDYILFYTDGPDRKEFNPSTLRYDYTTNSFDTRNHLFIGLSDGAPLEIGTLESITTSETPFTQFDDYARYEDERINLLGKYRKPGSGKRWFGDEFSALRERNYALSFPNIVLGKGVEFNVVFGGRSGSSSTVYVTAGGAQFSSSISGLDLGDVEDPYARIVSVKGSYLAGADNQLVNIHYPSLAGTTTTGWVDYIEMHATRQMTMTGNEMYFRNFATAAIPESAFELEGATSNTIIWDITDPIVPGSLDIKTQGDVATFGFATQYKLHEFVAFDINAQFPVPEFIEGIPNQNYHGISSADLVIITHENFTEAAETLAAHRRQYNNYNVVVLDIEKVYNEFSGGSVDPTAIRDFAAMLKARDDNFRFLLLVGDASYDLRHLQDEQEDDNFIPAYETNQSMDPIRSFPSDDYYALLDDLEGNDHLKGALDIAVGRLPVGSADEAMSTVNKIIHYDNSPGTFGDWRLRTAFVSDDEDGNLHLNQSEIITTNVENANETYNLNKIYLDAYPQVSTAGGPRYPDVNAAINASVQKGSLVVNYLGHGGHQGWSQERVLTVPDIQSWSNEDKLPVFVTATCSFTGYDEPTYKSAGEEVLLNPVGGAVALLTTVRAVYSSSNKRLTSAVFDHFFDLDEYGNHIPLGEVVRLAKNSNPVDTVDINARKFAIIGDPSMVVAFPEHNIALTEINGVETGTGNDTIGAMEEVTLKGEIRNRDSVLIEDFNGTVSVTIFDKRVKAKTLGNDPKSYVREFNTLSRVIFKGNATVVNGKFAISFVVPADIDFSYGNGKISMYATDEMTTDAAGSYEDIIIGGTGDDIAIDDIGPELDLFMNNTEFVNGQVVGPNPVLLVNLFDENGINILGSSIGHDLEGVLDNNTEQKFILNDFYEADQDSYKSGKVRYPLYGLEPGKHSITVTAWDVAGNFTEGTIEFVVETDPGNPIRTVSNYPNPMTGQTTFRIAHDLNINSADVEIRIYDVNGRDMGYIRTVGAQSQDGIIDDIRWDENTGDCTVVLQNLNSGVYLYNVTVTPSLSSTQPVRYSNNWGKLVLVN